MTVMTIKFGRPNYFSQKNIIKKLGPKTFVLQKKLLTKNYDKKNFLLKLLF